MSKKNPNTLIIDYLESLPQRVRDNILWLSMTLIDPEKAFSTEKICDLLTDLKQQIDPSDEEFSSFRKHGAAVIWSALIDYQFTRATKAPTSEEMLEMCKRFEAEFGRTSPMREHALLQDEINEDFEAAASKWQKLRENELSIKSIQIAFFAKN